MKKISKNEFMNHLYNKGIYQCYTSKKAKNLWI